MSFSPIRVPVRSVQIAVALVLTAFSGLGITACGDTTSGSKAYDNGFEIGWDLRTQGTDQCPSLYDVSAAQSDNRDDWIAGCSAGITTSR